MSWYDYTPTGALYNALGDAYGGIKDAFSAQPSQYQDRDKIQGLIDQGFGRTNQAAPTLDPTQQAQFRAMQMQQAQQLQRIASGQQQGAGELAAQRQAQNAFAQQQAMARGARGGNSALALRNAANNSAGIGLAAAGQGQQAALSDQQMAQGQLSGVLNAGRTGDISIAGQNATNSLQQQGLNNNMYLGLLQQLTGMNANELQARIQAHQGQQQLVGGLLSGAGQAGAKAAMG